MRWRTVSGAVHEQELEDRGTGRVLRPERRLAWLEHRDDSWGSEPRSSGTKLAPPPPARGSAPELNSPRDQLPFPDGLNPNPRRVFGSWQLAFSEASRLIREPHPDCLAPELGCSFLKTGLFWNMPPKGGVAGCDGGLARRHVH